MNLKVVTSEVHAIQGAKHSENHHACKTLHQFKSVCLFSRVWNPKHAKQKSQANPCHITNTTRPLLKVTALCIGSVVTQPLSATSHLTSSRFPNVICCKLKTKQRLAQTETECKVVDSCKTGKDETRWLLSSRP